MTNKMSKAQNQKYDLEERTAQFGEEVIRFLQKLNKDIVTSPLISQLVRSATSIGANYCEADCAESRKDFEYKIGICKKESKETKYWFRMLATALPQEKEKCRELWKECNEFNLIFSAIIRNSRKNKN